MAEESTGNLQNDFFNRVRRAGHRVSIWLVNGKKLSGRITSFDRYTLLLDSGRSEEVIFKHAISSVSLARAGAARPRGEGRRPPRSGDGEKGRGERGKGDKGKGGRGRRPDGPPPQTGPLN